MRDKSQIEDMRAALRGDLDRARARRDADPWRAPEPQSEPVAEAEPETAVEPEPPAEPEPVAAAESEHEPEPEREPEPPLQELAAPTAVESPPEPTPDEPRRGFFSRLFRRD